MTYQVLARKWRPQSFATLVGQQHVLQALVNALDLQRLHHAYLFTGTRGVGKTTIARLIAKALNCEVGVSSQPCGVCATCVDITAGRYVDLFEVDAASRTKVEDTRELLDNVQYAPTRGRYKVYLIDEVHMLSGHSFNALLKTLEEPPPHVKFLLATTDPQKLPVTVLSRCLQFHLKNLTPQQIRAHLADVLTQEALDFEAPALNLIAQAASGSMRDALSLLDQAIVIGAGQVSQSSVEMMLGVSGQQVFVDLLTAFIAQDLTALIKVSDQLQEVGADYAYVLARLQEIWHSVALQQFGMSGLEPMALTEAVLKQLAATFSQEDIQLFYEISSIGRRDLSLAPSPKAGFEMVLLRLLAFRPAHSTATQAVQVAVSVRPAPVLTAPAIKLPSFKATMPAPVKPVFVNANANAEVLAETAVVSKPEAALVSNQGSKPEASDPWLACLPHLGLTAFAKVLAEHLCFDRIDNDHFYMNLAPKHAGMLQDRHTRKIAETLTSYFNKPTQLTVTIGTSGQAKSALVVGQLQQEARTQQAMQGLVDDAPLQRVLQTFDAKLLPETLEFNP